MDEVEPYLIFFKTQFEYLTDYFNFYIPVYIVHENNMPILIVIRIRPSLCYKLLNENATIVRAKRMKAKIIEA